MSLHLSCESLRHGDGPASVYFNVLVARVFRKQLVILRRRGVIFAIADDVKILAPPEVIGELAKGFRALAWEVSVLKTQTVKNASLCSLPLELTVTATSTHLREMNSRNSRLSTSRTEAIEWTPSTRRAKRYGRR